jgi:16S rRNA (uracil1498-N3)-methyltransferase
MLRWRAIIREAAEQSRRGRLAEIEAPSTFADMLKVVPQDGLKLIAWEEANPQKQLSAGFLTQISAEPTRLVSVLIGPEGGFSPEEVALAEGFGFIQFSLGRRTLRMETACLAACAILTNLFENQA